MPYLRLTADRRGVEHTFLLHVPTPGDSPRVLYWYRTAPGLRIGRPALDDLAMRSLEEQHPDIDFDWPYILDVGAMTPVEVEAPLPPRKRKPPPEPAAEADADADAERVPVSSRSDRPAPPEAADAPRSDDAASNLLGELLGRGIAASLRARHAELVALVEASSADPSAKAGWFERLSALDPAGWSTPEAVLAGMATVDRDLAAVKADVGAREGVTSGSDVASD